MLYHLAQALVPHYSALNLFTYHTVRAGGAAITCFLFCLLVGPRLIEWLRALKIGQFIKRDHVADLHKLHKDKAGTPTMGGAIMILAATLTLLLWGDLTRPLLWVALGVFVLLGAVGFLDDYIKLRRKHNDGLSARAKFAGQILAGTLLGLFLVWNPITVSPTLVASRDVNDWSDLARLLERAGTGAQGAVAKYAWEHLPPEARAVVNEEGEAVTNGGRQVLLNGLNELLETTPLQQAPGVGELELTREARGLMALEGLTPRQELRLNRLLLENALAGVVAPTQSDLTTKVGVPGLKRVFIPLGIFYILLVILIIVAVSNAVNLTDGLDGLAAGAASVSIFAYTAIAYIVSRADWSAYLYLVYVPEASELFVFGSTLLGAGMGFLWFNAHPAEVFMGDTGSLALGGAIGAMAILTKQELLLPIVAGLFVHEAGSVVVQVGAYKLTGRRVFRMAPLHHHFELLGWSETKVTIRFWIIAFLFALMSLSTLKLR